MTPPHFYDIVILGASAAGVAACEAVRKRNSGCSLLLVTEEPTAGYYRPMLGDYLSDTHKAHLFFLHPESWYTEQQVEVLLETRITEVHPDLKLAKTADGTEIHYGKLILATGSSAFVPPVEGARTAGVFTLKTLQDADRIKAWSSNAKHAAVVGGGLLGLEAAHELLNRGLKVDVIEREERLMPLQLDVQGSAILEKAVLEAGITLHKGTVVHAIQGDTSVTGLELVGAEHLPCDLVILSAGVRPNLELPKAAGLEVGRGVVVNEFMETSAPDIYAAGDLVEFNGRNIAIWPYALEQGRIAAASALGERTPYTPAAPATLYNGFNLQIFSIGQVTPPDAEGYYSVSDWDPQQTRYRRMNFHNGVFIGGILINDMKKTVKMVKGLAKGVGIQEMVKEILEL